MLVAEIKELPTSYRFAEDDEYKEVSDKIAKDSYMDDMDEFFGSVEEASDEKERIMENQD